jgi:Acyl-CoA dehydrogenase, middle domain
MPGTDPGSGHIPPLDEADWYTPDTHLPWVVRRAVGETVWPVAEAALSEAGRLVPQEIEPLVRVADRSAMFLTEKAGGSDVGANETTAVRGQDGAWRLYGEKWFAISTGWLTPAPCCTDARSRCLWQRQRHWP